MRMSYEPGWTVWESGSEMRVTVTTDTTAIPDENYIPGQPDGTDITCYSGIDKLDLELTGDGESA